MLDAENSLLKMLDKKNLKGLKFIDVGCGSGIFSLAARNLGAKVVSFDYDQDSVQCAKKLKRVFYRNSKDWLIYEGSVLDKFFLKKLGTYDIVYSWGVLHHTGKMWDSLENIKINIGLKIKNLL